MLMIFLMSFYLPAQAGVYRWVDSSGQVHFGERPPPGIESKTVKPPPAAALPTEQGTLLRGQFQQKQADYTRDLKATKTAEVEAKAAAETRKKNCSQSRQAIASIDTYKNKRMFDENGQYLEDAARQTKLAEARKSVKY